MFVLGCLTRIVEDMRYPTFADVWNKFTQGLSTLFDVEFLCRVEAGPARLAHELSSTVLHDGVGGQDNAEAQEPSSATSGVARRLIGQRFVGGARFG